MRGRWKTLGLGALVLGTLPAVGAKESIIELREGERRMIALLNVAAMNRLGTAALTGTPARIGGFLPAFDRRLDTDYEPRDAGVAQVTVTFAQLQSLTSVRLLAAEGEYEWQLEGAGSQPDLDRHAGSYRVLGAAQRAVGAAWAQARWPAPIQVRVLRFTLTPVSGADRVRIREINLEAEQELESLYIKAKSQELSVGERVPLEVSGYFSGGDLRPLRSRQFEWQVNPATAARIEAGRIVGRRVGPVEVRVLWGKLTSAPLRLHVSDGV